MSVFLVFIFFFKQKTAYEMRISDWSSDVCSSDLGEAEARRQISRDRRCLPVEVFAQLQSVIAVLHHHAEFERRFALMAHEEGCGILIAARDLGHVRQFEGAPLGDDRRLADLGELVNSPVQIERAPGRETLSTNL